MTDEYKIEPRQSPEIGVERGQLFRPVPFFISPRRGSNAAKKQSQACEIYSPVRIQVDYDKA
jgi:hypothetical protein